MAKGELISANRYVLGSRIGLGAFSEVFEATDLKVRLLPSLCFWQLLFKILQHKLK